METKELKGIYRTLGRLIEEIKLYDIFTFTESGNEIINSCYLLWNNKNFSGDVFSDHIEGLNKEPYYVKAIAKQIKEAIGLGIDYYHLGILRGLDEEEFFYQFGDFEVEEEFQYWRYVWGSFRRMCNEVDQEAKEILDIYNYVFPNSKADDTGSNAKIPKELETEEARKFFDKARELGLISESHKWLKGLQLLSCFCDEMSKRLGLGKGGRTSWQPFEAYFGVESRKLMSNFNDIKKTGKDPSDINLVDEVFK